jgi:BlaI family transcriptional regulator, penicillinase repressor
MTIWKETEFSHCILRHYVLLSPKDILSYGDNAVMRTPRDVTEAELTILRILWEEGDRTVREVADLSSAQVPTVQKLVERLESKGWVSRDRSGPVQLLRATANRDDLIGRRLRGIAEELCEGSMAPLLSHLVHTGLSADDRKLLRNLIEQLDEQSTRKKRS